MSPSRFQGSIVQPRRVTAFALGLLLFAAGCATVAITGRSQLNMVSDKQLVAAANQNFSQFMGLVSQKNAKLSPSESPQAKAAIDVVHRVSDRIINAAGLRSQYQWETVVVKSREANAFVMPNGKIVVFTGLLPVAKTEAGLAAVIGHEVGHVVARHQAERMSQALLTQIAATTADVALAASNSKYRPVVGAALGMGAQYGILLPFSRVHESEADHIGLFFMAKAGYDPVEAIGVWERMEAKGGAGPWEFLSTHPSPATRRAQIREWLPEAQLYYADGRRPLPTSLTEVERSRRKYSERVALAPVALQPSLQPGFWTRDKVSDRPGIVTTRLQRVEPCATGECMILEQDTGRSSIYTRDFCVVEIREANGNWVRFSPALRSLQWPLKVGDSWTQDVVVENSSGGRVDTRYKAEVVSYESVAVPAGSLMTYKLVRTLGGRRIGESWYSPEARTFARVVSYDAQGAQRVTELIDYQKGDELTGTTDPK